MEQFLDDETSKKVLKQVEFYLAHNYLLTDSFLYNSISKASDGMISLELICSLPGMRAHLGLGEATADDISKDTIKAVAQTLKKSASLRISEDGKKVGRITPVLNYNVGPSGARTVAVSPLKNDVKREEIESLFSQHGKVNSVKMPRHVSGKRLFCGTALVEFSTKEDAETVLKKDIVFSGAKLELKPTKEFYTERAKLEEEAEKSKSQSGTNGENDSKFEPDDPKIGSESGDIPVKDVGTTQKSSAQCAVCKYRRRGCAQDCPTAPYFPAHRMTDLLNVLRLFRLSNLLDRQGTITTTKEKEIYMETVIFEANARKADPVNGCCGQILELQSQINYHRTQLELVQYLLELYGNPLPVAQDENQDHLTASQMENSQSKSPAKSVKDSPAKRSK